MSIITKRITVLFLLTSFFAVSQTYAEKYKYYIKKKELKETLSVLSSDSLEGRATGEAGQKKATQYIKRLFKEQGVNPAFSSNKYLQPYTIVSVYPSGKLKMNNINFSFLKDFIFFEKETITTINNKKIVYIPNAAKNSIDVKDKVVVLTKREVEDFDNIKLKENYTYYKNKGAAAVMFMSPTFFSLRSEYQEQITEPYKLLKTDINDYTDCPLLFVGEEIMSSLTFSKKSLRRISKGKELKNIEELGSLSVSFNPDTTHINTENVIAKIEGSHLPDEHLVIMGHYDHLGINKSGDIYNGAANSGTGVSALLALAKAFKIADSQGNRPKRTVLFIAVSGEEMGLFGSRYYTENPILPLGETVAVLNIDRIGRTDSLHQSSSNYVYIIGSDFLSSELHQINKEANENYINLKFDYTYNDKLHPYRLYYRSGHFNFVKHGVPSIFYFGGFNEDYNKTTDKEAKIEYDKLEKITKLVFFTAWELLNNRQRPVIDKLPK